MNVHLSCAISHSNASKLDTVLVDQCFTVFGGEKRREEKERTRASKKEKEENWEKNWEKRHKHTTAHQNSTNTPTHRTTPPPTPHTTNTTPHTTNTKHVRQPTVILSFFVNAWICAQRGTDRDLESVFVKRKVNARICARQATDRDLETKKWMLRYVSMNAFLDKTVTTVTPVMSVIFLRIYCFRFNIRL